MRNFISKQFFGLSLSLCLVFYSCKNCETKTVSYTEEEPYKAFEMQSMKLEYEIEDNNLHYSREEGAIILGINPKFTVSCRVINKSEAGGVFEFFASIASQGEKIQFKEKKYIPAQSTAEISQTKEINPFSFKADVSPESWGINAPIVDVRKEVTKYKTITKYRQCNSCDANCY